MRQYEECKSEKHDCTRHLSVLFAFSVEISFDSTKSSGNSYYNRKTDNMWPDQTKINNHSNSQTNIHIRIDHLVSLSIGFFNSMSFTSVCFLLFWIPSLRYPVELFLSSESRRRPVTYIPENLCSICFIFHDVLIVVMINNHLTEFDLHVH